MQKFHLLFLLFPLCSMAQTKVSINPTITPVLFGTNDAITVTYNATGTTLANLSAAYAWVWIPAKNIDAKYNVNPASSNATLTNNAKFTKSVANGQTLFTITFTPSSFFASSIAGESQMGILIKGNDWSNGQSSDYIANFGYKISLITPINQTVFADNNSTISIQAKAPISSTFEVFVDNSSVNISNNVTSYSYVHTVTETAGMHDVRVVGTAGANSSEVSFQYVIRASTVNQLRPPEIIPGINYNQSDPTEVTLCLWAPNKTSVYVLGDFSNWKIESQNIMKRDGEYFWITLSGLTSGNEYGFQYLVDEAIRVADPYADKILDPDDQYISAATYPNLKAYPTKALSSEWYFNRVSVFQTGQTPYAWNITNFEKPAKEKLIVYELLIRDFFDSNNRNYQNLIDTIAYLKRLGVNAIELMPIMEFNGNESWGYNPTFMFAPDKYYGTKEKFKQFVDICHENGIAVILDIALNHQDIPNPYAMMYFDFTNFKPLVSNPWFNVTAPHPFSVFFDMNHESSYTKAYIDTINYHWLNEYKVDGFRFDLSKGFTQTNNPNNTGAWSAYDASRIAILKRMADVIWSHTPDAYIILEHLGVNTEEKELAEYRSNEGKGMLSWGKMTDPYNQNTMGYVTDSDVSWTYHGSRGWSVPHVVGYMESHDEERLMFKNLAYGNSSGDYSVKSLSTALRRMKAAYALFLSIPGPKMIWQFGELGFDHSINLCTNGTIGDCRLDAKPVLWDYYNISTRFSIYSLVSDLLRLRRAYPIFSTSDVVFSGRSTLTKSITLKNVPYTSTPTSVNEMNLELVTNFDVTSKVVSVPFPHTGVWFDYYNSVEVTVAQLPFSMTLEPGEFLLFTDVLIENKLIITDVLNESNKLHAGVFPNPVTNHLYIENMPSVLAVSFYSMQGIPVFAPQVSENSWDVSHLQRGIYIVDILTRQNKKRQIKIVKH